MLVPLHLCKSLRGAPKWAEGPAYTSLRQRLRSELEQGINKRREGRSGGGYDEQTYKEQHHHNGGKPKLLALFQE